MKKLCLCLFFIFSVTILSAQERAVTETGEEVILYADGTWSFLNAGSEIKEIPVNKKVFKKSKNASFLLKSSRVNLGFWLDPKKWSFKKAANNEDAEYELQLRDGDLYGMIITEKVEVPLEALKDIAIENGRAVAPDLKIVKEEYRTVNGTKVLLIQMNGTTQGIKFSYFGYYYSNSNGTIQFVTYTSQNLLDTYENDCEELLNGIVEI
jgi:hypothetical protein